MSELNPQIKTALDGFDLNTARQLLREALPNADAETYYLASLAAITDDQRLQFLQKANELDPFHEKSVIELNKLKNPTPSVAVVAQTVTTTEQSINHPSSVNSQFITQVGIHKFTVDINATHVDTERISNFYTSLDYKVKTKRRDMLVYERKVQRDVFNVTIKINNNRIHVDAIYKKTKATQRFVDIPTTDARIRAELEDFITLLQTNQISNERSIAAASNYETVRQSIINKEYERQNSPAAYLVAFIFVLFFCGFFFYIMSSAFR